MRLAGLVTHAALAAVLALSCLGLLDPGGRPGPQAWVPAAALLMISAAAAVRALRVPARGRARPAVTAMVVVSVQLTGGFGGPLGGAYFLLLAWLAAPPGDAPAFEAGLLLGVVEALSGTLGRGGDVSAMLEGLAPSLVPLVTLPVFAFAAENLSGGAGPARAVQAGMDPGRGGLHPAPHGVLGVLHRLLDARATCLLQEDDGGGWTVVSTIGGGDGFVPGTLPPDHPVVRAASEAPWAGRMGSGADGLPFYPGEDAPPRAVVACPTGPPGASRMIALMVWGPGAEPPPGAADALCEACLAVGSGPGSETAGSAWGEAGKLADAVASARSMSAAVHAVCTELSGAADDLVVTVALVSGDGVSLDVYESAGRGVQGRAGRTFDCEGTVAGWTVRTGRAVRRTGLGSGSRPVLTLSASDPASSSFGSCSTAPLTAGGKCIGLVLLESASPEGPGDPAESILAAAASILGVAIERILLREQKRELQGMDGLTGLPRLTELMDFVTRYAREVQRFGRDVSLFHVSLESLPEVNASAGYAAGDALLRSCGRHLGDICGTEGFVARISGGRFGLCMPGMDQAAAEAFAEGLVRGFDGWSVRLGEVEVHPRISVGGASTRSERRISSLAGEAARALLRARAGSGRFHVVELTASGQGVTE